MKEALPSHSSMPEQNAAPPACLIAAAAARALGSPWPSPQQSQSQALVTCDTECLGLSAALTKLQAPNAAVHETSDSHMRASVHEN